MNIFERDSDEVWYSLTIALVSMLNKTLNAEF